MGILQFFMLLFFVLIYVAIVGGLLARFMRRGMDNYFKQKGEKVQEIPLGG